MERGYYIPVPGTWYIHTRVADVWVALLLRLLLLLLYVEQKHERRGGERGAGAASWCSSKQ